MKRYLKKTILRLTPSAISDFFYYNHPGYLRAKNSFSSFSQEGEDMVLRRIFSQKKTGLYADIGAHHPSLFSNTNYFYQIGWTGINVDAIPGSKTIFDVNRPNDINLELAVSENEGLVEFYLFEPDLMNTMSAKQAKENEKFEWCKFKEKVMVPSMPLSQLLDRYLVPGQKIDFMTIDVEGAEMTVLKSNNWEKYTPDVLLVEMIDISIEDIAKSEIHKFLTDKSYVFFAKTGNTLFYKIKGFFEF